DVQIHAIAIELEDDLVERGHESLQVRLLLVQLCLRLLTSIDVLDLGNEVQRMSFRVMLKRDVDADPDDSSGLMKVALLPAVGSNRSVPQRLHIVGVDFVVVGMGYV